MADSTVIKLTIPQKLQVVQKMLGLTQTKLAQRFGVSFAAFNSWWTGKSQPRPKMQVAIDELFLEVTGQKIIPADQLTAKKQALQQKSKEFLGKHTSVVGAILDNPDIRDQFILKLTYHSNSIEGSTLTEPDTAAILFDNVALPNKSIIEQLEAKNHQTALNYLFDHVAKKAKINEALVFKLHGILMNSIKPDAGAYRNHGVRITGVNLPTANYASVSRLMGEVMGSIAEAGRTTHKKTNDIVSLCAASHSKFEQIHPFSDGNGRMGRLLMDAMLLEANLPPAIILQQRKRLYYAYLYKAQTKSDQSQLEDFLCDAIVDGFKILERTDL